MPEPNLQLDKEAHTFVTARIVELRASRKDVYGFNIDELWNKADKDYRLESKRGGGKKVLVSDEETGWRSRTSNYMKLGASNWQNMDATTNPFVKIQSAISILFDKIPEYDLIGGNKRYDATSNLQASLLQRNWQIAKSKEQLKVFLYCLSKYGFAVGRTYHRLIERSVQELVEYIPNGKSKYETTTVTDYNDIWREALDPMNVWIDDMARPGDRLSCNDWCWRRLMSEDEFKAEFSEYPKSKEVKAKGGLDISPDESESKRNVQEKEQVEVIFYENRRKDMFVVIANDIMVVNEPLPYDHKDLSCWFTYWNLRHQNTIYGVGLLEIMRMDKNLLEKVQNMTMDQLVLSIYKMFFFSGTDKMDGDGTISIKPGVGRHTLDPKGISFLEIPGPGKDAYQGLEYLQGKIDTSTSISKTLEGEITGKTAFEVAQAKEASLKRLKTPLENIESALQVDAELTVSLMQQVYSIPQVEHLVNPEDINAYLDEVSSDPQFYGTDEDGFYAFRYKHMQLGLEKNENDEYVPAKGQNFFTILPDMLRWKGQVKIKPMSILSASQELDKVQKLELANLLFPLFQQPPELYKKPVEKLLKVYKENPKEWLPDTWLAPPQAPQGPELFVPRNQAGGGQQGSGKQPVPGKETMQDGRKQPGRVVPTSKTGSPRKSLVARSLQAINPFGK